MQRFATSGAFDAWDLHVGYARQGFLVRAWGFRVLGFGFSLGFGVLGWGFVLGVPGLGFRCKVCT